MQRIILLFKLFFQIMIPAVLFLRQHALITGHAVRCLSSISKGNVE